MIIKLSNEFKFYVNYSIQEVQNISEILSDIKKGNILAFVFFPERDGLLIKRTKNFIP